MKFFSTKDNNEIVSFRQALLNGIAKNSGLYLPASIPNLKNCFFESLYDLSFQEISYQIAEVYLQDEIPPYELHRIINNAINFDAPLIKLDENNFILELFHGPTFAFKDFGARFLAELLLFFNRNEKKEITILTATSGDTGGAVANAFIKMKNIKVVLLYPANKISRLQEKQLTTYGENITAMEVNGTFDDCQRLVKTAFNDNDIKEKLHLSSANSINIGRLLPQTFYYFYAYKQMPEKKIPIVFSVPCGNLGNITAGIIAQKMGLPVNKFIAATNVNSVFTNYIRTKKLVPAKSQKTYSNAMDVGSPNNFQRLVKIFDNNFAEIKKAILSYSISDGITLDTIKYLKEKYNYLIDPHGAVGFAAASIYAKNNNSIIVTLGTAHPAKFNDVIRSAIGSDTELPAGLKKNLNKKKNSIKIENDFRYLKEFLLK